MTTKSSEDFWNTSSSSAFNFDDDDDELSQIETVFTTIPEETSILSIHSIISKNSLDLILEDVKSSNEYVVLSVEETIRKMLTGQKCSLEVYKKFSDKLLLLDSSIEIMDGNIILNVVLFLKSTLKRNLFFNQLAERKIAVKHYANYLTVNGNYQELADLYMRTGSSSHMKQLYYFIGRDINNKEILRKRLETFRAEHLQKVNNNDDKLEFDGNSELLEWQVEKQECCESVIEQLAVLCKKQWEKDKNSNGPIIEFKKRLKIDDFSYEWTCLNVLASMQLWPQLSDMFTKPNWLTKKTTLKTAIPVEIFVYGLSRHDPPKDVLEHYLPFIPDAERSLCLAQKMNCHKYVIQHHINQRDRLALILYKSKVSPKNDEYFLLENALQSIDKKWKN